MPEYNHPYRMGKTAGRGNNPNKRPVYGVAIGELVGRELNGRGWTQGQLAAKAHSSQEAVSQLIGGMTKDPKSSFVIALASALEVPVDRIMPLAVSVETVAHSEAEVLRKIQRQLDDLREAILGKHPDLKAQIEGQAAPTRQRRRPRPA